MNQLTTTNLPAFSAELRAEVTRYRALIETSTSLVWRAGPDGDVLEGWGKNEYSGEFLEEYMGRGWISSVHPDDQPRVMAEYEGPKRSETSKSIEYRIRRSAGEYRWVHARAVALTRADGTILEWIGTLTDIHEQRKAMTALKSSEERLRLAVESTGLGLWDHDLLTNEGWWSDGKLAVLGLAERHPIGLQVILDLVVESDRPAFSAAVQKALDPRSGGTIDQEFRILRASDGAERWVASSGQVFFNADGTPVRILGTVRDITERRTALENFRNSQERFRRIAETSPNACICLTQTGYITYWNRGAQDTFGYTAGEILGHSIDRVIPERFRAAHRQGLKRAAGSRGYAGHSVELTGLHQDGHEFPLEGSFSAWLEGRERHFGALLRDVSERRRHEERLYRLAHYDHLTDLPNRVLLRERMAGDLQAGSLPAMLLLDLDGFKVVNDTLGHEAGDLLLIGVAQRLAEAVPQGATLARIGGDEFAISLPRIADAAEAEAHAEALRHSLSEPFIVAGRTAFVGASIGIALAPDHGNSPQELMANADLALHRAKEDGRNAIRFFLPKLKEQTAHRQNLEIELRRAFKRGEFEIHLQPQVRLQDRSVVGAEALLRWQHPERGLLFPGSFLSVLKASPLAAAVGDWTIRQACIEAARLKLQGYPIRLAVNLFSAQFRVGNLVSTVERALSETGLPPHLLELEVTENTILKGKEGLVQALFAIRSMGLGLAFDDYGTGYASLSMLKQFPLTRLKIDKGFVQNVESDPGDVGIIQAIVQLGRTFNLEVTAEGVETNEQEALLTSLGCVEAQGYLYSRAIPAPDFLHLLDNPNLEAQGRGLSA